MDYGRTSYGDYLFPVEYDIIGWGLVVIEVACVPVVMVYKIATYGKDVPFLQVRISTDLLNSYDKLYCLVEHIKKRFNSVINTTCIRYRHVKIVI